MMPSLLYSPWKGWKLSSSWLGRTGPPLGPTSPHEGAETDPSPRPLHCDWAYKPGGEKGVVAVAGSARRREEKGTERGQGQRRKWKDINKRSRKKEWKSG